VKLIVAVAVFAWLLCGVAGDWMLEGSGELHWKKVAKGPITLIQAFREKPVTFPDHA